MCAVPFSKITVSRSKRGTAMLMIAARCARVSPACTPLADLRFFPLSWPWWLLLSLPWLSWWLVFCQFVVGLRGPRCHDALSTFLAYYPPLRSAKGHKQSVIFRCCGNEHNTPGIPPRMDTETAIEQLNRALQDTGRRPDSMDRFFVVFLFSVFLSVLMLLGVLLL